MKIFIQGRKDGYNTLYPKPTPAEFFQFASDIQRIDAQNNSKYYGKSLYSIAFNGNGCISTKYIIGYDTLRSNIGNIGISVYIPNNQKMSGADIKTLLDDLINIYTTNYCPDFKINNQKQEDWLLFSSYADSYNPNVKPFSSDENFQYGNKDAAYIFYNNTSEIEKYLETPYQEEYKVYKQILFIENQSQLILEVIKHDPTANLTGDIDLENPSYKLREYHGQGKNGISIEIRANGKLRNNKDKIFRKDIVTIKYSKKYYKDIFEEGKLTDPQIEKYLMISDNSIDVVKNIELPKTEIPVEIRIYNRNGESISDAIISCKNNNYSKIENQVYQNTIIFLGEEQKDSWTISAKRDSLSGGETFTPEHTSVVKLTLKEVQIIRLKIFDERGIEIRNKSKDLTFYDDEIRMEHTEFIDIPGYQFKKETFIPKNKDTIVINLEKEVYHKPYQSDFSDNNISNEKSKSKKRKSSFIKILLVLSFVCLLVVGGYYLVDMFWGGNSSDTIPPTQTSKVESIKSKLNLTEIQSYVEGDSLFIDKLNSYKDEWAELKDATDSAEYRKYEDFIDKAIIKRQEMTSGNFAFFNDNENNVKFSGPQQPFRKAVRKIKHNQYDKVKSKLGDVSMLTLTQIADSINKILALLEDTKAPTEINGSTQTKKEVTKQSKNKSDQAPPPESKKMTDEEIRIIEYLEGDELKGDKLKKLKNESNISEKLKSSIDLALEFWNLDGSSEKGINKTYHTYKLKVKRDKYLKNNNTLKNFVENATGNPKYPKGTPGAGKTLALSKFIQQAK